MTILESTLATALEAAMRTRLALDPKTKDAIGNLEGKRVQLNMSEQKLMVSFDDRQIKVRSDSTDDADMELTGSMASISQALVSNIADNVVITGNTDLLEDFRLIFQSPINANEIAQATKATADWGIAAAKSAFEMASTQFENLRTSKSSRDDVIERLTAIETKLEELNSRIEELENR